ncbi:hypothetical protein [Vibrio crassostreae]|uniref:hypothetical protein n=1 Tax=Vibrio crassostreae TaxID=246167 RepID=UPI001B308CA0|nr:hypothetical protein [Vibrio crassostreae]
MIQLSFKHSNHNLGSETITLNLDPNLLQDANETLANAIVDSIHKDNGYGTYFQKNKYCPHSWDLHYEEAAAKFMEASIEAEKEARQDDDLENYPTYLRENIDRVLAQLGHNFDAEDYYYGAYYENFCTIIQPIQDAITLAQRDEEELDGIEIDDNIYTDDFEELLRDRIVELMEKCDDSTYNDILPSYARAELNVTLGHKWGKDCAEDTFAFHEGNCSSVETVDSDKLQALFDMANVSPQDFAKHLLENDYEAEVAEGYNNLVDNSNGEQRVSFENLIEVMDNATYGGIPMQTAYIECGAFVNRDITKGFTVTDGVLGLEDVINGSGHNADFIKEGCGVFVEAGGIEHVRAVYGSEARDNVYCYYKPALHGSINQ